MGEDLQFQLMFLLSFIALILSICWFVRDGQKKEDKEREKEHDIDLYFQNARNIGINLDIKSKITNGFVGIDKNNKQLLLVNSLDTKNISMKSINFKDIMSCELVIDGTTKYKKSATRAIGGAVMGGILLGGVGAVVGGLSGSSKEKRKIKRIDLKIVVRDIENPCMVINFLNCDFNLDESCIAVQDCMNSVNEWKDRISAIIDMEDNKSK